MKLIQIPRLFIADHWGGTETVLFETCTRLQQFGHQPSILTTSILSNPGDDQFRGIPIRRVSYFYPYIGLSRAARDVLDKKGGNIFSFEMLHYLKQESGLDLIHLHTGKRIGGICRYAARHRGIPYIVSIHGGVYDVPKEEAATWTEPARNSLEWGKILGWWTGARRVLDDADGIICVGRAEQKKMQLKFPEKRVDYLPNGVSPERFATGHREAFRATWNIPADAITILTLGRIDHQKNQRLAVELLGRLRERNPHVHLMIIGYIANPDYYAQLVREIDASGLKPFITLIPGLPTESHELIDAFHASDIFLLPSRHEPFGIVILEAWAAHLPVVASRIGGIPYFVEDGTDGLLCDPDSKEAFHSALQTLIDSHELRSNIGRNGYSKACNEYDWNIVTRKLESIYTEIIENHKRKAEKKLYHSARD